MPTHDEILARILVGIESQADFDFESVLALHPQNADELRRDLNELSAAGMLPAPLGKGGFLRDLIQLGIDDLVHLRPRTERAPSSVTDELVVPRVLGGRYRLRSVRGRGGMGIVYTADDLELQREVALKLLHFRTVSGSESRRRLTRLLREARITGQLDHPGIVPVYSLGLTSDRRLYFTMMLVRGRSLRELVRAWDEREKGIEDTFSLERRIEIVLRLCDALAFAHERGVVHRDLSPNNVMVGRFGEVLLMDWGIAKLLDRPEEPVGLEESPSSSRSDHTTPGGFLGTPNFAAPELARGDLGAIDVRTDVFGVGALLHYLLTGQPPYVGRDRDEIEEHARQARRCAPTPTARFPRPPRELVAVSLKAMAADPSLRYPTIEALAADLRAFLENRVVKAYRTGAWPELVKWTRRNRTLAAAAVGMLVLVLAASVGISIVQARGRERADVERRAADEATDFLTTLFTQANPNIVGTSKLRALDVLEEGRKKLARGVVTNERVRAQLLAGIGGAYRGLGEFVKASKLLSESWELLQRLPDAEPRERANVLVRLSLAETSIGHYDQAIAHLQQCMQFAVDDPSPGEINRAAVLVNLGDTYSARGDGSAALDAYARAEQLLTARGALDTAIGASVLNSIAVGLRASGRHREAMDKYQHVLAIMDKNNAPPQLRAAALQNLAFAHLDLGELEDARQLVAQALAILEPIVEPNDPMLLAALATSATIDRKVGDLDAARTKWERVLAGRRDVLGPDARETWQAEHNLGTVFLEAQQFDEADPLIIHALDAQKRVLGADHEDTLASFVTLGTLRKVQGRLEEARTAYRSALDGFDRAKFVSVDRHVELLSNLMCVEAALGASDDARGHARRLLELAPAESPLRARAETTLKQLDGK